mmetsp:Transcript_39592/g.105268  ORF Transcript_39592/g.105268 Transcript_39592/m.105268 type:complete len:217 (-) Transcript_39592:24-674(-)
MTHTLFVLVGEACGLGSSKDAQNSCSRVSVSVGGYSASSKIQTGSTPLWNEVLEIPVKELPCCANVVTEVYFGSDPCSNKLEKRFSFEILLTDTWQKGFCSERIRSSPPESEPSQRPISINISCSFDSNIIQTLQQGLWPCQPMEKASISGRVVLMRNSPLIFNRIRSDDRRRSITMTNRGRRRSSCSEHDQRTIDALASAIGNPNHAPTPELLIQ